MIKKIRITNHNDSAVRDTTIGKVYDVTFHSEGAKDSWGFTSHKDTLCFRDDRGDKVSIWTCDPVYEVVDGEEPKSSTEVEGWNTVNWDKIPVDVEAVVTFEHDGHSYYKEVGGQLQVQSYRGHTYYPSVYASIESVIEHYDDRVHLRPTLVTKSAPETHESIQVESSEVKATTTPEFDWSNVDEDVEAVIVSKGKVKQCLKVDDGVLLRRLPLTGEIWEESRYQTLDEREERMCHYRDKEAKFLRRPPATTPPEIDGFEEVKGSTDLRLKCRAAILSNSPSISTILQEAQQSILKHHGVTGKVKFTVTCSE